ncbi:hypothetical protein DDB_G0270884 [Dictyostelium discoideum AX4]|uniref:Actobindin-A n=1 Tax=Dictyostelium discoideum TaxID=44689 RepID=ACTOA_DICDI|nr:hypothetical protein DDB_G0270884 [Dictyostelium discoideum AX4]Q55DU3.1 RecName: Full=Actobindin-A [Dictyostelium discoideum]EAL72792.1 hypothetical protein DDB_G0270884 [Dictyostelium discoideum AX4]|eukprot:XP_646038.1 hypothetical protein DDB_G0270884 [Dictyostelium discoideum AX4]
MSAPNPLLAEINKGADLKHTETQDKSAPKIGSDVHIKKNDHASLLSEVEQGAKLKHAETDDKSAPKINENTTIKPNNHSALLGEIKAKAADS